MTGQRRMLAIAFGLLMTAAVAVRADAVALPIVLLAAVLVLLSAVIPRAATVAVLACVGAVAVSDSDPVLLTLAGLTATCYLALCHTAPRDALTRAGLVGVLAGAAVGLTVAVLPAGLPWVPLAGPLAVVVAFAVVVQPLRSAQRAAQSRSG